MSPPVPNRQTLRTTAALIALTLSVVVAVIWGRRLSAADPAMLGGGSPWFGKWRWQPSIEGAHRLVATVAVAGLLLWWWPRACRVLPLRVLPWVSGATSIGWAVTVAANDGWASIPEPLTYRGEYLAAVSAVRDPLQFLDGFVTALPQYPVHVRGHPPGQVLLLWFLEQIGLGGGWPAAVQTLGFGGLAVIGVLTVVRWEGGEAALRHSATFVGLTPAVWTVATSTDPTFGALAVGAVLLGFAAQRNAGRPQHGRWALGCAAGSGTLAAVATYFTYAAPLFLLPATIPLWRLVRDRRHRLVGAAVAGAALVVCGFTAAGFRWWDGLAATREAYQAGIATHRPFHYFVFANLVVFAVAVGPATLAGALRKPSPGMAALIVSGLAGVVLADLSGLSKGEVERIWLPFVPWVALAAAPLARCERTARRWLAVQLVVTLALQLTFVGQW